MNIEGFLALLEEYEISHPSEKSVRASLPRLSLTSGNSTFLLLNTWVLTQGLTGEKTQNAALVFVSHKKQIQLSFSTCLLV